MKYDPGPQKARQSVVITPKLSKCSRKEDKESNSETQSSSSEEEEGDEENIFTKCNHYKENRNVAKVDSDMLIEFHQS